MSETPIIDHARTAEQLRLQQLDAGMITWTGPRGRGPMKSKTSKSPARPSMGNAAGVSSKCITPRALGTEARPQ